MEKVDKLNPSFSKDDVTIHSKNRIFKKRFAIDEYIVSYKKFKGGRTHEVVREIFERDANAVAILPYDAIKDEVVLIEQFRPGALNNNKSPWLFEVVAGMIDEGESIFDAAKRELFEESGLELTSEDDLYFVNSCYPSPGGTSEIVHIFIANIDSNKFLENAGLDCEDEDIRVFKIKSDEAFFHVKDGSICNCAALVSLMALQINKDEIKEKFLKRK